MIKLGNNEMYVLSALLHGEQYGLEIVETIRENVKTKVSMGSLYPTLYRLEKKELVESRWGEATEVRAGARRRYYKMTGLGERVLKENQAALQQLWSLTPQGV